MRVVSDVIIIGAGALGCSAAYHLARLHGPRIIVIEKGSIASGMTKRSVGMVHTHYASRSESMLALASLGYFQNWEQVVGGRCGFIRTGLAVVAGDAERDQLHATTTIQRDVGARIQILSPDELATLEPMMNTSDLRLVSFEEDAGYADAAAVTQAFAGRAREKGVVFQTGTFAKSILVERGRVYGVATNTGNFECLNVVIAAGPWSDRLLKPLGIGIGIRPRLAEVAFFERPAELKRGHTAVLDRVTGAYFRPHTYGLSQAGMICPAVETMQNPDSFEESVSPEHVSNLQHRVSSRLPALAQARFVRGHTGIYDMTAEGHSAIGRVPEVTGLMVAAGMNGAGFALAPAAGACVAEIVVEGSASTVKLPEPNFVHIAD